MNVCCCQLDIAWEDKPANFARAAALLEAARPAPGSLVLLPEMFATGFSMNVAAIAEDAAGPTPRFLAETARRLGVYLAGGFVTRDAYGAGRNELAVFDPGGARAATYQKIHPFSFGEESRHYAGGADVVTFGWAGLTVAPFICYDLRFPEVFRHATLRGAELLLVIANWPEAREQHWLTLARARAIENQAFLACVNRVGHDPKNAYAGRSMILSPRGDVLADAGGAATVISAALDPADLRAYRAAFPALADVRRRFLGLPEVP